MPAHIQRRLKQMAGFGVAGLIHAAVAAGIVAVVGSRHGGSWDLVPKVDGQTDGLRSVQRLHPRQHTFAPVGGDATSSPSVAYVEVRDCDSPTFDELDCRPASNDSTLLGCLRLADISFHFLHPPQTMPSFSAPSAAPTTGGNDR